MKNSLSDTMPRSETESGGRVFTQITGGFQKRKEAYDWVKSTINPARADFVIRQEYTVYINYKGVPISRPISTSMDLQNVLGYGSPEQVQASEQTTQTNQTTVGGRMRGSLYGGKKVRL
jgi:hypothetical protein